ncbi:PH domain-containing protein [Parabacteroides sp. OttesenSCG-928-N08]|nr:PH domain-containing protein [Parabacteroides sp. OttesenSCG-928-N08]
MEREFRSKIGWWYYLIMGIVAALCIMAMLQPNVLYIVLSLGTMALLIHLFLNTWYRVTEEGILVVHSGFFPEKRIAISEIEALEPTVMPVSSPALSLDRLIIWTNGRQWLLISPQNQSDFIKVLQNINPDLVVRKESTLL